MSLKSLAKAIIPPAALAEIRRRRTEAAIAKLRADWDKAIANLRPRQISRPLQRLLLVPCDPNSFSGSLGDDAMIAACIKAARARNPNVEIRATTSTPAASAEARRHGCKADEIWEQPNYLVDLPDFLNTQGFDAVAVLGADVMDGYYDPPSVMKMLATCDIAARSGVPAIVLGFSFNAQPSPYLRPAFARLGENVQLKLRDPLSLTRFRSFSDVPATLVSDSAFSLAAGNPPQEAVAWIDAQHASGRQVIGINIHPLLIKNATPAQVEQIIAQATQALEEVAAEREVSWLLLPHDYRETVGDGLCLAPIRDRLSPRLGDRVAYLEGRHPAADLKALAGRVDGVMTGRMHLVIGSMGMGTPTMSVIYQDKFEGLYRHFDLPDWLLMTPGQLLDGSTFREHLVRFIDQIADLRQKVEASLPHVLALSRENFSAFD